jgi:hypothetical protein
MVSALQHYHVFSLKPLESFSETLLEQMSRVKPKKLLRTRDIQTAARLALRLCSPRSAHWASHFLASGYNLNQCPNL